MKIKMYDTYMCAIFSIQTIRWHTMHKPKFVYFNEQRVEVSIFYRNEFQVPATVKFDSTVMDVIFIAYMPVGLF